MALSRIDETDIVSVLHGGLSENPPWATFLARLRQRVRADRALLAVVSGSVVTRTWESGQPNRPQPEGPRDGEVLLARLRPGRVYSLAELAALTVPRQAPVAGLADGRFVRVAEPGGISLCVALLRATAPFASGDGALLVALAPHLAIALANLAHRDRLGIRAAIAEDVLRRAGLASVHHDGIAVPEPRWRAAGGVGETLLVPAPAARSAVVPLPAGVAIARVPQAASDGRTALLAEGLGLTASEARLAISLAEGRSLAASADVLGISEETARNYSKRIYAKTGTRGQADLVRRVLLSLARLV